MYANFILIHTLCKGHKGCINHQPIIRLLASFNLLEWKNSIVFNFFGKPCARLFSYSFALSCLFLFLFFFHQLWLHQWGIFPWITRCAYACIYFRLEFFLYQRFFNNLLTLPHVPTTPKASLLMLASEHLGCISGPWRIVLPFLRDFDNHFLMLSLISGRFKFCSRSVCDARLLIDQN